MSEVLVGVGVAVVITGNKYSSKNPSDFDGSQLMTFLSGRLRASRADEPDRGYLLRISSNQSSTCLAA